MGYFTTVVPTEYAAGVGSVPMNLICQSPLIPLEIIQRGAHACFGTALGDGAPIPSHPWISVTLDPANNVGQKDMLYSMVNANVVIKIIENILTPKGWDTLMLQQHKFAFSGLTEKEIYDGLTMLKVFLEEVDPIASVNLELHRHAIEGSKLQDYKGNFLEICKAIERHY